jgi:hypothetical protein
MSYYWKLSLCTIYKSSLSPGFAKQIMSILLLLQRKLGHLNGVSLTAAKFKPLIFSTWFRLVLWCEHVHSHVFVWFLLDTCTILLYNHIHTEVSMNC